MWSKPEPRLPSPPANSPSLPDVISRNTARRAAFNKARNGQQEQGAALLEVTSLDLCRSLRHQVAVGITPLKA